MRLKGAAQLEIDEVPHRERRQTYRPDCVSWSPAFFIDLAPAIWPVALLKEAVTFGGNPSVALDRLNVMISTITAGTDLSIHRRYGLTRGTTC